MMHAQIGMRHTFIVLVCFIMQNYILSIAIFINYYLLRMMKSTSIHIETKERYDSATTMFQ